MDRLVLLALLVPVTHTRAECWVDHDGTQICSHDPNEWVVVWWVWLALLAVAGILIGYCGNCFGTAPPLDVDKCPAHEMAKPLLGPGDTTEQDSDEDNTKHN